MEHAEKILRESSFKNYIHLEDKYPFVECATFADAIKKDGFADQSSWHYVNTPLVEDSFAASVPPPVLINVTWAIEEMVDSLKQVTSNKDKYPDINYELAESFNLRLLIHYVGDIHQPLHAVTRFDSTFEHGDEGGNYFSIEGVDGIRNLHMLWDSVLTAYDVDMHQPLSE